MKRALLIFFACALQVFAVNMPEPRPFSDGTYVGMEPMPPHFNPDEPEAHWFHQNTLTIKGNAVTLSKSPIFFKNDQKFSSASDGGFFMYRGTLTLADRQWRMELLLTDSDYVAVRLGPDRKPLPPKPQQFTVTRTEDGSILVGKVIYRKSESE